MKVKNDLVAAVLQTMQDFGIKVESFHDIVENNTTRGITTSKQDLESVLGPMKIVSYNRSEGSGCYDGWDTVIQMSGSQWKKPDGSPRHLMISGTYYSQSGADFEYADLHEVEIKQIMIEKWHVVGE